MEASLILFVFFIITYIVIGDIITIFFRLTGLTEEKARFQVISLLTNSGFTTRESESVVATKLRRRLARATMIFGYAFTVTIVSTTVNFFMTLGRSELDSLIYLLPVLLLVLFCFNLLRKSPFFRIRFDKWIENLGNRLMHGKNSNPVILIEDYGDMALAHILLTKLPSMLSGTPLSDSDIMAKHKIMVLTVKGKNGETRQADAGTVLHSGDIVMVMGKKRDINEVFEKNL